MFQSLTTGKLGPVPATHHWQTRTCSSHSPLANLILDEPFCTARTPNLVLFSFFPFSSSAWPCADSCLAICCCVSEMRLACARECRLDSCREDQGPAPPAMLDEGSSRTLACTPPRWDVVVSTSTGVVMLPCTKKTKKSQFHAGSLLLFLAFI